MSWLHHLDLILFSMATSSVVIWLLWSIQYQLGRIADSLEEMEDSKVAEFNGTWYVCSRRHSK